MKLSLADLDKKIAKFLSDKNTGQITLNVNEGRIESFDLRLHGRVVDNGPVETSTYAVAVVARR